MMPADKLYSFTQQTKRVTLKNSTTDNWVCIKTNKQAFRCNYNLS